MVYSHQLAADQPGRRAIGDAQRQIDPIVDQIHVAIFQPQPHVHLRVAAQELRHVRMQHEAAHRLGHADADQPLGLHGAAPADRHDRVGRRQQGAAVRKRLFAAFAQPQFAGGAVQQLQRQRLLEFRHAAADGGRRGAQFTGSGGKAAALYHLNENGHFGQQGVRKICAHDAKVHCDGGGLSLDYDMNIMALRTEEKNDDRTTLLLQ